MQPTRTRPPVPAKPAEQDLALELAAANVTDMVMQIAASTGAQAQGSERIQTALQVFREAIEVTTHGAEAINASVAALLERAARLETEIGRFKTD